MAAGSPTPWVVSTQCSCKAGAVPEYGDPMADEVALGIEGAEAVDTADRYASGGWGVAVGEVAGMEG